MLKRECLTGTSNDRSPGSAQCSTYTVPEYRPTTYIFPLTPLQATANGPEFVGVWRICTTDFDESTEMEFDIPFVTNISWVVRSYAAPHGSCPTWIVVITEPLGSITETLSLPEFVT